MNQPFPQPKQEHPLYYLKTLYEDMEKLASRVIELKGKPLCVPDCGLCCETTTPLVLLLEGRNIAMWLDKQSQSVQDKVLQNCEAWLLKPLLYKAPPTGKGKPPEWVDLIQWQCPALDTEKKTCLIYPVRPLGCRTYGVTRGANAFCKAPLGLEETKEKRLHFSGPPVDTFVNNVNNVMMFLKSVLPPLARSGFLPFFVYMVFCKNRMMKMLDYNTIHYAKMVASPPGIIPWTITQEDAKKSFESFEQETKSKIIVAH